MSSFNAIAAVLLVFVAGCGGRKGPSATVVPVAATDPTPTTQTATANASPPAMEIITSDKGSFSCQCPKTWQTHSGDATVTLVPASDPSGTLDTLTLDVPWVPPHLPGMITIGRVEKGFTDDVRKKMTDVVIDTDTDQALPDSKARRIHIHARTAQGVRVIDAVLAIHDESVYVLDAETDANEADDAHKTFEGILASWHWTK